MSRLNPRRRVLQVNMTTSLCTATTIHTMQAGALLIHRPAWVDQHTSGSRLTPTVHRCPKGMVVGGSSPQHEANFFLFLFLFVPIHIATALHLFAACALDVTSTVMTRADTRQLFFFFFIFCFSNFSQFKNMKNVAFQFFLLFSFFTHFLFLIFSLFTIFSIHIFSFFKFSLGIFSFLKNIVSFSKISSILIFLLLRYSLTVETIFLLSGSDAESNETRCFRMAHFDAQIMPRIKPMWFDGEMTGKRNSCRRMRWSLQGSKWESKSKHVELMTRLWKLKLGTGNTDADHEGDGKRTRHR